MVSRLKLTAVKSRITTHMDCGPYLMTVVNNAMTAVNELLTTVKESTHRSSRSQLLRVLGHGRQVIDLDVAVARDASYYELLRAKDWVW